ncbi:MAG: sigma-70 family RNA polymerase sigma factor [Deltaproteobacteria bacterium]|nr:sigma-70 family RNA polymerase sigma factor [Deltaproteobacteria bacterium]
MHEKFKRLGFILPRVANKSVDSSVKKEQKVVVDLSDRELVRKCQAGNLEAFQGLVAKYYQRVLMVVLGIVRDRDDAMEVAQEVFYKAYSRIRHFRGRSTFYTWLYRIAVNQCIDFRRRQKREPAESNEGMDEVPDEHGRNPSDVIESAEFLKRLYAAMESLTPEHKAVIVLRAVEGLSYKEISSILGCSEGTVMSRLHYARKRLQEKLAPYL